MRQFDKFSRRIQIGEFDRDDLRREKDEKCQKTKSADENLRNVRQAVRVAKKVGKGLGGSKILQRQMPNR
jgi:predicted amidophosphoribosyltransferase